MAIKSALLAFHDPVKRAVFAARMEAMGIEVDHIQRELDLVARLAVTKPDLVLMEANLGSRGSPDISPAIRTYRTILPSLEHQPYFLAVSDSHDAVRNGRRAEVPVMPTAEFTMEFKDYLRDPYGYLSRVL